MNYNFEGIPKQEYNFSGIPKAIKARSVPIEEPEGFMKGFVEPTAKQIGREFVQTGKDIVSADPLETISQTGKSLGLGMLGFADSVYTRMMTAADQLINTGEIDPEAVKIAGDARQQLYETEITDPGAKTLTGVIGSVPAGVKLFFDQLAEPFKEKSPNIYAGLKTMGDLGELAAFGEVFKIIKTKEAPQPAQEAVPLDATFAKDQVRQNVALERARTPQRPLETLARKEESLKAEIPTDRQAELEATFKDIPYTEDVEGVGREMKPHKAEPVILDIEGVPESEQFLKKATERVGGQYGVSERGIPTPEVPERQYMGKREYNFEGIDKEVTTETPPEITYRDRQYRYLGETEIKDEQIGKWERQGDSGEWSDVKSKRRLRQLDNAKDEIDAKEIGRGTKTPSEQISEVRPIETEEGRIGPESERPLRVREPSDAEILEEKAREIEINSNKGTLISTERGYFYSPDIWVFPKNGLKYQPNDWKWLGSEGWADTKETHKLRRDLFERIGKENIPESPNEYIQLEDIKERPTEPKPPKPKEAEKEPWKMTKDEFLAPKLKKYPNVPDVQKRMWSDQYDISIDNAPRNANIPINVLESLSEGKRKQVLKFNETARNTWDALGPHNLWRITYREALKDIRDRDKSSNIRGMHKASVEKALSEGKPVPQEVLKDYPDLKPIQPPEVTKVAPEGEGVDRDSFTVSRVDGDLTFKRGEYVKAWINSDTWKEGKITGISHAKKEFKIGNLEYEFARAYKTEEPKPNTNPVKTAPLSEIIDDINKKNAPPSSIGKAWIKQQQKPIMAAREIKKGKNKGKIQVTLTAGRRSDGSIKAGRRVNIYRNSVIEWPEGTEPKKAPELPKVESKKEKALREYNEYVDNLTNENRNIAGDLIVKAPEYPSRQKLKIERKLKRVEKGNEKPSESIKPKNKDKRIAQFRKLADGLQKQINEKRNPAISQQNLTARRARIAAGMAKDADYLEKRQTILRNMADAIENGTLPKSIEGIKNRAQIDYILRISKFSPPDFHKSYLNDLKESIKGIKGLSNERDIINRLYPSTEHRVYLLNNEQLKAVEKALSKGRDFTGKSYIKSDIAEGKRLSSAGIKNQADLDKAKNDLERYIEGPSEEVLREQKLKKLERDLIGVKIPGFFPTPKTVVNKMLDIADIEPGMKVLEPSAGKGDIADVIKEKHPDIKLDIVEYSGTLTPILEAKGYKISGRDFLEYKGKDYDRIVMNPPFEKLQDIDHVKYAYGRLKEGGRLVSIMSESPFFRSDKKAIEFREWLDDVGGTSEKLDTGSFKGAESFRQTGVSGRIVTIDKTASESAKIIHRPIKEIAKDINTAIGERGSIGIGDLTPEQEAAIIRLKGDIENIKSEAKKVGKTVERYLLDRQYDPKTSYLVHKYAEDLPKYARSINLQKQDISEDYKAFEATLLNEKPKKTQSWKESEKLAQKYMKDVKTKASLFERSKRGQLPLTTEKLLAMRQINVNAIEGLKRIVDTDDPKLANAALDSYRDNIGHVLSDASSEVGRMLNIHKKEVAINQLGKALTELKKGLDKRRFEELKDLNLEDPVMVQNFIKNLKDPKLSDYFLEYWYNSILSGPPTHVVNIVGNTLWTAFQVPQRAVTAAVDKVYSPITGKQRRFYMNEIVPMLAGYKEGFKRGSKIAGQIMRTGKAQKFQDKWFQELDFSMGAWRRSPNPVARKLAPFVDAPTRALRAMDVWANAIAYDGEINSIVRRMANDKGLKGKERLKFENEKKLNITDEMHEQAVKKALNSTFMDEPDPFTQYVISARNIPVVGPVLRMTVLPFVNTISNLTKRGIELTPGLGIAKEAVSRGMGRGMPTQKLIAKQIIGAVAAFYVINKAAEGRITGPMPKSKNEREAWYRQGKKPWSIKIGGEYNPKTGEIDGGTWYQYRRFEPYNTPITSAYLAYEEIKKAMEAGDEETATEHFGNFADQFKNNVIDGSYLSGLQQVLDKYGGRKGAMARWGASWVPYSSFWRSINRSVEVLTEGQAKPREGQEWLKAFSQVIPGLSGKMPAKLTVWGKESVIPGNVFQQWLPFKWSKETDDPVEKELARLEVYPSLPRQTVTYHNKEIKLPDDVYRKYCIDFGSMLKKEFDWKIKQSGWSQRSEEKRINELKTVRRKIGLNARRNLVRNYLRNLK